MKIIPAILTSDPDELSSLLKQCEPHVDRVQIDIIDGEFAGNETIAPSDVENLNTKLHMDFHLMVERPIDWIGKSVEAGSDRVIGQIERMESQALFVDQLKQVGVSGGLALDLRSDVSGLDKSLFGLVDCILVMSVAAGFGGQEFDPLALKKIAELNEIRQNGQYSFSIIDDGGITLENIGETKRAGVDEVSVGRRLFKGDLKKNIERFEKGSYGW